MCSLATELSYRKLWAALGEALGKEGRVCLLFLYTSQRSFLSFAIMNSVPSFKRACEIFICSLEHKIFKGQFLSCLLSWETWFGDSLKGDQIVGLCVNAPSSQWEWGGGGKGGRELLLSLFLKFLLGRIRQFGRRHPWLSFKVPRASEEIIIHWSCSEKPYQKGSGCLNSSGVFILASSLQTLELLSSLALLLIRRVRLHILLHFS